MFSPGNRAVLGDNIFELQIPAKVGPMGNKSSYSLENLRWLLLFIFTSSNFCAVYIFLIHVIIRTKQTSIPGWSLDIWRPGGNIPSYYRGK